MRNILFPLHNFEYKYRRMPEIISGYTTEQMVRVVPNSEEEIQDSIDIQADNGGWLVSSLTLSGTDVIILFTRTIAAA